MRKVVAGAFGVLAIGAGVLLGLLGAATLAYGGFIGVAGQGHYPKWLALVVLPVGVLFSFTAYGSVRLGLDAFAADGDGEEGADK